jgi:hypothetical protein
LIQDELIPFSDTPQVSRFGPISRRGTSIVRPSKPSQSLACMDDEPTPTAVVRHSKQITKPLPPTASLFLQNGSRAALQPVAVGANGEIGYIAVQEAPVAVQPQAAPVQVQQQCEPTVDAALVFAESERMKHELEVLQRKISDLNMAQQYMQQQQQQQHIPRSNHLHRSRELTSELQLIENTIRDREMEMQVHTQMQKESPQGLDYGSYKAHGNLTETEFS